MPQDPSLKPPLATHRLVALIEVIICSDFPTQLALGSTLAMFGYRPFSPTGQLQVGYVVTLSLADALLLVGFVLMFLYAHGEKPRDLFVGRRPILGEVRHGVLLIFVALAIAAGVLLLVLRFAPWLHTVQKNPMQELMRSRGDAALFALVAVVAGGIREEVQRAFLLHRFEVWLGGGAFGLVVTSLAFGAGHLLQGVDAVIATGLLGAFWGAVYLRRRSIVAPMVSHAGFDLIQILGAVAGR